MKFFFSLILIISITLSCVNSTNIKQNINKLCKQNCFTNGEQLQGYICGFVLISFTGNTNSQKQYSIYENGFVDVDFENHRVYTTFSSIADGEFSPGRIWAFGNNKTEYLLTTVNGQEVCYSDELSFSSPTIADLEYYSDETIGTFPNEAYKVASDNILLVQFRI